MFNKKGVVGQMVGLAIGIVVLAVIATIGVVVVSQLGNGQGAGPANNSAQYAANLLGSGTGGLLTWLPVKFSNPHGLLNADLYPLSSVSQLSAIS